MNDKLVGQIMKKFVGLRPKTYSYLKENKREENKRAKVTKKCTIKLLLKSQQRFKSQRHNVSTEEITKIALSWNDDKRIQSIDLLKTYSHGMSKDFVSKKEKIKRIKIIKQYKNVYL